MAQTAKIFTNGGSQAVRLPLEFQFDQKEVLIRRDAATGNVILSRKPQDWDAFFKLARKYRNETKDFMVERDRTPPQDRDPFK